MSENGRAGRLSTEAAENTATGQNLWKKFKIQLAAHS